MPKKPASEIKKLIHIRLSPESLSYVKRLAETTRRDLTNMIEYLIYLHSSKQLKEPIPYFTNKESVKSQTKSKKNSQNNATTQEHMPESTISANSESSPKEFQQEPVIPTDTIVERPFDD